MKRLLFFVLLVLIFAGCRTCVYYFGAEKSWEQELPDNLDLGIPGESDQIINRPGYALGYSQNWKQPLWVTYRLTKDEVDAPYMKRTNDFRADPNIVGGTAVTDDYWNSGYDRGHLAPAADMYWSTNAMSESFYMSNMSPQTPQCNRKTWLAAEIFARQCAKNEERVTVVSGPIVTNTTPTVIGKNEVVVPDAFFKVIYDETPPEKMIAFVIPNENPDANVWLYVTNVVYVEEVTGLNFFPALQREELHALKLQCNTNDWFNSK